MSAPAVVVVAADAPVPAVMAEPPVALAPPTLADAAALTPASDFSAFVARNVDAAVRRLAMKTLFADPHFQGHDGLDVYMTDFTAPSPMSEGMLAQLSHSKGVFATLEEAMNKVDALLGTADATDSAAPEQGQRDTAPPTPAPTAPSDQEDA